MPLLTLILLWFVLFLGRLGEAQLKFDALTYATLAKHMLSTGDWLTLHYSSSAYANWHTHPPLVFWIQALFFKCLGVSTPVARLMPSLFALGTICLIYVWGRQAGSRWIGFVAGFILLLSTRYLKYASDLMLDGPFTFWLILGAVCFLGLPQAEKKKKGLYLFGYSVAIAAAFLSKGLITFCLLLATLAFSLLYRRKMLVAWGLGLAGALLVMSPWLLFANGTSYLQQYWSETVVNRLRSPSGRFGAMQNLLSTYWPWLPFFCWGAWKIVVRPAASKMQTARMMALGLSLIIFFGFTYSGYFLEHYLVPFYPCAALVAAIPFEKVSPHVQERSYRILHGLALVALVLLAIWPYPIRARRTEVIREAAIYVNQRCQGSPVSQVLFTETLSERWLGLAAILWETPWDAKWATLPIHPEGKQLLLTSSQDRPSPDWSFIGPGDRSSFALYRPAGTGICP